MLVRISDKHIINICNVAEVVLDEEDMPFKIRMCNGDVLYIGEGWEQGVFDAMIEYSPFWKKQEGIS